MPWLELCLVSDKVGQALFQDMSRLQMPALHSINRSNF